MDKFITLAHGAGGKASQELIQNVFVSVFNNDFLSPLEDQARINLQGLVGQGEQLAFTTDSYVIDPIFFNGGDIGSLAVCGTVNDLCVGGATPRYLSCAMVLEEGFAVDDLKRIVQSMKATADRAGVQIVTGDTKVVARGAADKIYINTAGIGTIPQGINIQSANARSGDVILCSGSIGDHGASIISMRSELGLSSNLCSDCAPLNSLVAALLEAQVEMHCLRDATRGGVATVLNEFASASQKEMLIHEDTIPVRSEVRGLCELLGLDPLYLANEGKLVAVLPADHADKALQVLRQHPLGEQACVIGEVKDTPQPRLVMQTLLGSRRIVDRLVGDQYPRIC